MESPCAFQGSTCARSMRVMISQASLDKTCDSSAAQGPGDAKDRHTSGHSGPFAAASSRQQSSASGNSSHNTNTTPLSGTNSAGRSLSGRHLKRPYGASSALETSHAAATLSTGSLGMDESVSQGRAVRPQRHVSHQEQGQLEQLQQTLSERYASDGARDTSARGPDADMDMCWYSDRFIPSRSASYWCRMRLLEGHSGDVVAGAASAAHAASLSASSDSEPNVSLWGSTNSNSTSSLGRGSRGQVENGEEGSMAAAYNLLLKSQLLGLDVSSASSSGVPLRHRGPSSLLASPVQSMGFVVTPSGSEQQMMSASLQNRGIPGAVAAGEGGESELPNRNMLRFRRSLGPLQALPGGAVGLGSSTSVGFSGVGMGEPGVASWLGHCESPLSLSPLGSDADVASSATAPLLSPSFQKRKQRKIARSPYKVLDAPALQDDFYLNLVDWSSQNVLAVGLGSCCYLWSAVTSKVTKLCDVGASDSVCSVSWTNRGTCLSVGTSLGDVQIWDVAKSRKVRSMGGHRTRVGALSWSSGLLASGSRDHSILVRDIRAEEDFSLRLEGHRSEVCGLKWSPDERELASGGNDNQLLVWSASGLSSISQQPLLRFQQHTAAVKAIAWSPHEHGLLASGGGTADRCIRFWNTSSGSSLSWVDTGSQVCNLAWSRNANELVSTHGYSQNQIVVWRYPSMSKLATLTGHTMRVLFLAMSPDGQTIVTGAGDETLRFWNVFPGPKTDSSPHESVLSSSKWVTIR